MLTLLPALSVGCGCVFMHAALAGKSGLAAMQISYWYLLGLPAVILAHVPCYRSWLARGRRTTFWRSAWAVVGLLVLGMAGLRGETEYWPPLFLLTVPTLVVAAILAIAAKEQPG